MILGAGGTVAQAWETGVITGMAEAGIDLRDADLLVGTSGGAVVATQIAGGLPLEELL